MAYLFFYPCSISNYRPMPIEPSLILDRDQSTFSASRTCCRTGTWLDFLILCFSFGTVFFLFSVLLCDRYFSG